MKHVTQMIASKLAALHGNLAPDSYRGKASQALLSSTGTGDAISVPDPGGVPPGVTVTGTDGNDVVTPSRSVVGQPLPTAADDILLGLGGNDSLNGGLGADRMEGGTGNDAYAVENVGDSVVEAVGSGTDTVHAAISYALGSNVENLVLTGASATAGTGNELGNKITGNAAANLLLGLAGNDLLDGGLGADQLEGGIGNDTYIVDNALDHVVEALGAGRDLVKASVDHMLGANVENLALTGAADLKGTGNELANVLTGNAGGNILYGLGGNDTLDGKAGSDFMYGGAGNDTYLLDHAGDVVIELAGEGIDTVKSSVTYAMPGEIEKLLLTGKADLQAAGNGLDNVMTGNAGNNKMTGGFGDDSLLGGAGDDFLIGDIGADMLTGGAGADYLAGGYGSDTFVFTATAESRLAAQDTIYDFRLDGADRIDLSRIDANSLISGNQAFTSIGNAAFSGAGQVRVQQELGYKSIQADINGDGVADLLIKLHGTIDPVAADFLL